MLSRRSNLTGGGASPWGQVWRHTHPLSHVYPLILTLNHTITRTLSHTSPPAPPPSSRPHTPSRACGLGRTGAGHCLPLPLSLSPSLSLSPCLSLSVSLSPSLLAYLSLSHTHTHTLPLSRTLPDGWGGGRRLGTESERERETGCLSSTLCMQRVPPASYPVGYEGSQPVGYEPVRVCLRAFVRRRVPTTQGWSGEIYSSLKICESLFKRINIYWQESTVL